LHVHKDKPSKRITLRGEIDMSDTAYSPIDEWRLTSGDDELGADEAHIWRGSLDQPADVIAELAPLLSQDEYQRAMRYYRPVDRDRFIVGRGILRKIMSVYLALPPGQLRFTYNEYGKPAVSDDQNDRALDFNLSHSAELILCAVARGRVVGIDIEYIREDFATLEIAEHFFSKDEVTALKSLPADQRTRGFFNCWSRKEAFIKAKGMGVSYPLDRFTVSLAPGEPPALLKIDDDEREVARWKMYELKPGAGYAAAMIATEPPVTLKQRHWNDYYAAS
jgi:4'-phosphopantetheinyl transferase